MLERIDDFSDPRLDDYRNLTDGELLRDRGLFMAEGRYVVRTLFAQSRYRPRSVLLTGAAMEGLRDLIVPGHEGHAKRVCPVYITPQEVMNRVAGFNIHRGCLAAVERGGRHQPADLRGSLKSGPATLVILENIANHDNVGGVFRNAAAFSSEGVILNEACVDPLYRKAVRVSMGGVLRVPYAFASREEEWSATFDALRQDGFVIVAMTPAHGAIDLNEFGTSRRKPERVALVCGAEGEGLTPQAMDCADFRVRIPIASSVDSLNVATACGIALHWFGTREDGAGA